MKYYFDTCVWIAYLNPEDKNHEETIQLFEKIEKERGSIIVSYTLFFELQNNGWDKKYLEKEIKLFENKISFSIQATEEDKLIAFRHNEYTKRGYGDCLHLQLVKKESVVGVSYDEDWHELGKVYGVTVFYPSEVLAHI